MRTHKKVTRYFKSRNVKAKGAKLLYKVERHRDGKITCSCPGFMYTAVGPKGPHCKHAAQAQGWA